MAYAEPEFLPGQSQTPASSVTPAYAQPLVPTRVDMGGHATDAAQSPDSTSAEPAEMATGPGDAPPWTTVSAGSAEATGVTVHQVRLGPDVQQIEVSRSAGVQVGDHNRQLNHYQFKLDRPQVSLDDLLEGHPGRLHALERLAANPDSWMANYAFRHGLSAGPATPGIGVLFADVAAGPTMRISAHVDEYGAMVVESSRGVQVTDHGVQRNDFQYRLAEQDLSLEGMLRARPDLVRGLAVAMRHPGHPAVERSFTRQISQAYIHGSEPSLQVLNLDWPGSGLSVEGGAGVQWGTGNSRTDEVSLDIRRMALTGWQETAEQIAAKIEEPAAPQASIDGPDAVPGVSDRPAAGGMPRFSLSSLFMRKQPDADELEADEIEPDDLPRPWDPGPSIGPF
jgi:hypothetical protein